MVGQEVSNVVLFLFFSFFFCHYGIMLRRLTTVYYSYSQAQNPVSVKIFGIISLCNVLYKIISRVLVNRLQEVLSNLVSKFQNAFILGRHISDNIFLTHELLEFIRHKKMGEKEFFAVKLDMNKAYDRISWSILVEVLRKLGFSPKWVDIIYIRGSYADLWFEARRPFVPLSLHFGEPSPFIIACFSEVKFAGVWQLALNLHEC